MRIGFLVLLLVFAGALASARADVIFSGSVSTFGLTGRSCLASGSGSSSLNLNCSDPQTAGYGIVAGSGDPFSGSMSLHVYGGTELGPLGLGTGLIQLQLNETYVLTGGIGFATANFAVDPNESFSGDSPSITCSFAFDGMAAQSCGPVGTPPGIFTVFSETVEYGVPFSVALDVLISANSTPGEPGDAYFRYDFAQPGLAATPEPSSIFLLMPGLAGVMFAARSRARRRFAQAVVEPHP